MATRSKMTKQQAQDAAEKAALPPMAKLWNTVGSEAAALAACDGRGAEWLIGSMILGIANRAAFEVTQSEDRMAMAGKLAASILADYTNGATPTEADELPDSASEVTRREYRKHRDAAISFELRAIAYRNIYNACSEAWKATKGGVMPDQFKASRQSGTDDEAKARISAAF